MLAQITLPAKWSYAPVAVRFVSYAPVVVKFVSYAPVAVKFVSYAPGSKLPPPLS